MKIPVLFFWLSERGEETAVLLVGRTGKLGIKGNRPQTGNTDDCEDNTGEDGTLSAEQHADKIQTENPDAAPVDSTNNHKGQNESVHMINLLFMLSLV